MAERSPERDVKSGLATMTRCCSLDRYLGLTDSRISHLADILAGSEVMTSETRLHALSAERRDAAGRAGDWRLGRLCSWRTDGLTGQVPAGERFASCLCLCLPARACEGLSDCQTGPPACSRPRRPKCARTLSEGLQPTLIEHARCCDPLG